MNESKRAVTIEVTLSVEMNESNRAVASDRRPFASEPQPQPDELNGEDPADARREDDDEMTCDMHKRNNVSSMVRQPLESQSRIYQMMKT